MRDALDFMLENMLIWEQEFGRQAVIHQYNKFLKYHQRKNSKSIKRQTIPKKWIRKAWLFQDGLCARCGEKINFEDAVGDHIIPIVSGGRHEEDNIAAMSKSCNSSKGANSIDTESRKSGRLYKDILK